MVPDIIVFYTLPDTAFPKLVKAGFVFKLNGCTKTSYELPSRSCNAFLKALTYKSSIV